MAATKSLTAKEAKLAAQKRATELKDEQDAADRKRQSAAAKRWKKKRASWFHNELLWIVGAIEESVNKGENKATIWLASSDKAEQAKEESFCKGFAYTWELNKIIAHFKKLEYKVEFRVKQRENVDLTDLNPRDNWYTYETLLEISW